MKKFGIDIGRVILLTAMGLALQESTFGQGLHVTLRSQANPVGAHRRYAELWAEGNYAYVGSDSNYSGVLIFDVSNPDSPFLAATYNPGQSGDLEDVKVVNGIGYFASNSSYGVHIVNLADPVHPQLMTRITSAQGGYDLVHNIWVDSNLLYEPNYGTSPAVKVFDVTNPAAPTLLTTINTTDPQWIHDMIVQNGRLYTSGWGGITDIWDVSNIRTTGAVRLGSFSSGPASHSCWPTADAHYLACTTEVIRLPGGTLTMYDISNPANVVPLTTLSMASLGIAAMAPSNPVIIGNLMYVSWDQAGLLVFDITNPAAPIPVGNYDQYPGPMNVGLFDGAWGVFPQLGADRVMITDRDTGLWILDTTGVSQSPLLLSLQLSPSTVIGGQSSTATSFFIGAGAASGTLVTLTSTPPVSVTSVLLPAGQSNVSVTAATTTVPANTTVPITAAVGASSTVAGLSINAVRPTQFDFTPNPVIGGSSTKMQIMFDSPAAVDTPVSIVLTSGAALVPSMPSSVIVPQGSSVVNFSVATLPVAAAASVYMTISADGAQKSGGFTVKPNIPAAFSFSPSSIVGGTASATGKITFSAPVIGDTIVTLTVIAGASALTNFPATVTVPSGSTTTTWTAATAAVLASTPVQITAAANGGSLNAGFTVTPNIPTTVSWTPAALVGGATSTGKVTFGTAVSAGTIVTLTVLSGNTAMQSIPASVTIPSGSTSITWPLATAPVAAQTTVQISAAANGGSATSAVLTVNPNSPSALSFTPASVVGGSNVTGQVTLPLAATADTPVTLSILSGSSVIASIPASVTVPMGSSTASWTISTNSPAASTSVQISASTPGGSKTASFTVTPNIPGSVVFSPTSIVGPGSVNGQITFGRALVQDTPVTLMVLSGAAAITPLPATVTALSGSTGVTFSVSALAVSASTPVQVSAAANGGSASGTLTVAANVPTAFSVSPTTVVPPATVQGTVTFGKVLAQDTPITIAVISGAAAIATIPTTVTGSAGASSATFSITPASVSAPTTVQLSATANGVTKTSTLTVTPNVPTAFTFTPGTVIAPTGATGLISFGSPLAQDTPVTLTVISGPAAISPPPATVTALAGTTSVSVPIATLAVTAPTTVQISATANGGTKTGTLTVNANGPISVIYNVAPLIGGLSATGTVTFSQALAADTVVALGVTAGASAVASLPPTVTVLAGTKTVTFSLSTNFVATNTTVQVTATANGISKGGSIVVAPNSPEYHSYTPTPAIGGQTVIAKVQFTEALANDTVVTLSVIDGNAAIASIPASVTALAESTFVTYTIVTAPVAASTVSHIVAAANNGQKTGILTVNPPTPSTHVFSPTPIVGGGTTTGTVSFLEPVAVDTVVTLNVIAGAGSVTSVPATVTALAGSTSASYAVVTTAGAPGTVQITAAANGGSKTGSFVVQ